MLGSSPPSPNPLNHKKITCFVLVIEVCGVRGYPVPLAGKFEVNKTKTKKGGSLKTKHMSVSPTPVWDFFSFFFSSLFFFFFFFWGGGGGGAGAASRAACNCRPKHPSIRPIDNLAV